MNTVTIEGIGIHTDTNTVVNICPAIPDTGIVFWIMENNDCVAKIGAHISNVVTGNLRTVLTVNDYSVSTPEHLLAALFASGIDNATIKVWGNEIPILDGSALKWATAIESAGWTEWVQPRKIITIQDTIRVGDDDAWCQLEPYDSFVIDYNLHYDHPEIGHQTFSVDLNTKTFMKELASARTFGFYEDLEMLQEQNLATGASIHNTLVYDEDSVMNVSGSRFDDEPVRHKIVDVIGDLSLAGAYIKGKFTGYRSGHSLNHQLVRKMLENAK
jgi:UDP-3-O-[3-hydroxymyristoyl] N-acetylglucosamine deacetylase